ncbi:hypothetical protein B0H63DRAFT_7779 [Podospora didyma]|uniref:Uncharacterized protein n=1 Tax=Podospora didyma TaxID=330526 RepID=A0AAE0U786_9PEZI|nr:hypothetical protein B0H63DRAFT_7779 [Podospora didyma]
MQDSADIRGSQFTLEGRSEKQREQRNSPVVPGRSLAHRPHLLAFNPDISSQAHCSVVTSASNEKQRNEAFTSQSHLPAWMDRTHEQALSRRSDSDRQTAGAVAVIAPVTLPDVRPVSSIFSHLPQEEPTTTADDLVFILLITAAGPPRSQIAIRVGSNVRPPTPFSSLSPRIWVPPSQSIQGRANSASCAGLPIKAVHYRPALCDMQLKACRSGDSTSRPPTANIKVPSTAEPGAAPAYQSKLPSIQTFPSP